MVDDEPELLEQAKIFLESELEGLELHPTSSPMDAAEKVEERTFDAVISDYQMPGMDGLELLKKIREVNMDIPFIIFTGRGHEEVAIRALNLGADRYLRKGGDPRSLYGLLARALEQEVMYKKVRQREKKLLRNLRQLTNTTPVGVLLLNDIGVIKFCNPEAEEILGFTEEDLKGTQFMIDHVEPLTYQGEPIPKSEHPFSLLEDELDSIYGLEVMIVKDDTPSYLSINIAPLFHEETLDGAVVAIEDITEMIRSQEKLAESERKYRTLVSNLPGLAYRCRYDEYWTMELISDGCEELTGHLPSELIGNRSLTYEDLIHPDDRAMVRSKIDRAVAEETDFQITYRLLSSRDKIKWVVEHGKAVYGPGGKPEALEGMILDITDQKDIKQRLAKNERFLASIFESLREGICVLDTEHRVVKVNRAMEEMFPGLVPFEGKRCHQVFLGSDEPCDDCVKETTLDLQKGVKKLVEIGDTDSARWLELNHYPQVDVETGANEAVIISVENVTGQRIAIEKMEREKELVETLLDALPVYFVAIDPEGEVKYVNRMLADALGYQEEDMLGKDYLSHFVPEEERLHVDDIFSNIVDESEETINENRILTKDGDTLLVEWRGRPLLDGEGSTEYFFGVGIDITEKKRKEEELKKYRDHLEKLVDERTKKIELMNEDLKSFTYSVTHDLRAPLRAIMGFAQAVWEDHGDVIDEEGMEYLERVNNAAGRMDLMIQDLMDYSRLSRKELKLTSISPEGIFQDVMEELEDEIKKKGAEVRLEGELPCIKAHEDTLQQVFYNIVSNAIKFVDEGVEPRVKIWGDESEDRVKIYIQDNGIGIKKEAQETIFQPFERLHGRETYPGIGIGLSIAKRAVERMGGVMGLDSAPDEGSTFWVEMMRG